MSAPPAAGIDNRDQILELRPNRPRRIEFDFTWALPEGEGVTISNPTLTQWLWNETTKIWEATTGLSVSSLVVVGAQAQGVATSNLLGLYWVICDADDSIGEKIYVEGAIWVRDRPAPKA